MNAVSLPIAIIGAGPVGIAAAAHLLARGETPLVLEAGSAVATHIRHWEDVHMFTPWRFCVDRAAAALLATRGWIHPPQDDVPSGGALVAQYLEPLGNALRPLSNSTRGSSPLPARVPTKCAARAGKGFPSCCGSRVLMATCGASRHAR